MGPPAKGSKDTRPLEERQAARHAFVVALRQAIMEFDAHTLEHDMDFREFSSLIREREIGVHSEVALKQRFDELDADETGTVNYREYITYSIRNAFARSAASLVDLFKEWDEDSNGLVDRDEFKKVVRSYGFKADDDIIDGVFDDFDRDKSGTLDLFDLTMRLQAEAFRRPLLRLRSLQGLQPRADSASPSPPPTAGSGGAEPAGTATSFEGLSPEQMRERLWQAMRAQTKRVIDTFRRWDTNGDGQSHATRRSSHPRVPPAVFRAPLKHALKPPHRARVRCALQATASSRCASSAEPSTRSSAARARRGRSSTRSSGGATSTAAAEPARSHTSLHAFTPLPGVAGTTSTAAARSTTTSSRPS